MHRYAVDVQHWLSDRQFSEAFALAQITPGPNVIIVTLIGYHVAGVAGGLITTLAMCGPTCVFAYFVGRASDRFKGAAWHGALSRGLIPVTLGLLASSATVIATTSDYSWLAMAITAGTAIAAFFVRVHPLWAFAVAASSALPDWFNAPQARAYRLGFWPCRRFDCPSFNAKLMAATQPDLSKSRCANIST